MKTAYYQNLSARPQQRRRRGSLVALLLVVFLGSLLAWMVFRHACRAVSWYFLKVERADYGILEESLPLDVFIAREEEILVAPATGKLIQVVPEGERVPVGATIA
ncbi:MAG: hypothetical protein H5T99_14020, partial [Moorella sp. (in: Bacteria)]|nr:hypothetical protein [Moorella sp. (in: firmicutes)]